MSCAEVLIYQNQSASWLFMYRAMHRGLQKSYAEAHKKELSLTDVQGWVMVERPRHVEFLLAITLAYGIGTKDPDAYAPMKVSLMDRIAEARGEESLPSGEDSPPLEPDPEPRKRRRKKPAANGESEAATVAATDGA